MKYIKKFLNHTNYETFKTSAKYKEPNISLCKQHDEVHYNPLTPHDYSQDYLTFEALQNGTFQFSKAINYSIDNGTTWVALAANTATPTVTSESKIIWKAELTPNSTGIGTFSSTCNFDVEGNAMSLLYGDNFVGQTDLTGKNYAFHNLFNACTKLINAKNLILPATTLASYCYRHMFDGCTSLISAPELPAITLTNDCYYCMFYGCTNLTTAPELPATTLANYCYEAMFQGCTALTTAPELPATTLGERCYEHMFHDCTSLTTAPLILPATTLTDRCYQYMFYDCPNLTTAPELPATTLTDYCYQYMFVNCTSLTTAPELPATTLTEKCYYYMFDGCSNLNYIKALFTEIQYKMVSVLPSGMQSYTDIDNWVRGVAATGTFVKNSAATWNVTGNNGVPNGWTTQLYVQPIDIQPKV